MSRYRGPKLRITRRLGILPGLIQKQSKKKINPVNMVKQMQKEVKKSVNMVYVYKKSKRLNIITV